MTWRRFGDVPNLVVPFAGSLGFFLGRPADHVHTKETVNDLDGFISNFWRALAADPEAVAKWADFPIMENDLHARHYWLVQQAGDLTARLEGDPDYYDVKIAGWWVWGMCIWIGGNFCGGNGPWHSVDGKLVKAGRGGINRVLPHLGDAGRGINRTRPHLGSGGTGQGIHAHGVDLYDYFRILRDRLRRVRVASGDWSRVCGPSVTYKHGMTAVFLDPIYAKEAQRANVYRMESETVAHDVRRWAIENGHNPLMRIALCGYEREHGKLMPDDWEMVAWKTAGGYAGQRKNGVNDNGAQERIWFSPHCLKVDTIKQMRIELFEETT